MTQAPSIRAAFQGERGAFSEDAVFRLFGDSVQSVPCASFETLFGAINNHEADCIVAPLENTLAGSIGVCYDLWLQSGLHITREVVIPIHHCLIGCENASIDSIRTVESHPVALAQCKRFFAEHPLIHAVAASDTAGSVRHVVESADKMLAAIASASAARIYSAKVLQNNLEDDPKNFTRFALLAAKPEDPCAANKTTVALTLVPESGALSSALSMISQHEIDLIKIECRPILGRPWEYIFVLDLAAGTHLPAMQSTLEELKKCPFVQSIKILGTYIAGEKTQ